MVKFFKGIIDQVLRFLAYLYLKIKKIKVIAITGSAGKTTTKVALGQFLAEKDIYIPKENYNTETGVPLVIFGEKTPDKIVSLAWAKIIVSCFIKLFRRAPFKWIVLEVSADKPGDISYLTTFVKPKIAIVTTVLPVHTEEFGSVENIAKEKGNLVKAVSKYGLAILNYDNELVRSMRELTEAGVLWVGEDEKADLRYENIALSPSGLSFDLIWKDQKHTVHTKIIAPQLLISLLSAFAVGIYLKEDIEYLVKRLEEFTPEKGRMNLIEGKRGSLIIDDSYNANPGSTIAALEVLGQMPGRKIAALGSMRELGKIEKTAHIEVAKVAAKNADIVVTVGEVANHFLADEFEKLTKKKVERFTSSIKAGEYLAGLVEKDDVVLAKGSQNTIFMEEAVKKIMAHPEKAADELVRQSKMWEDKKANI
jgi:UDP-N-acetylmuramoyl-tripeptide--D-alanyl-D-alanine ligase